MQEFQRITAFMSQSDQSHRNTENNIEPPYKRRRPDVISTPQNNDLPNQVDVSRLPSFSSFDILRPFGDDDLQTNRSDEFLSESFLTHNSTVAY